MYFDFSINFILRVKLSPLVQMMAWHQTGDKYLSEPVMALVYWRIYASLDLDELKPLLPSDLFWIFTDKIPIKYDDIHPVIKTP